MLLLGLFLAGCAGACARYLVDAFVLERTSSAFPTGTFVVNVTGSLLLGFLTGLVLYHAFPATPKTLLGTGFCGAYTTFSTFSLDTLALAERGAWVAAGAYIAASVIASLAAVWVGVTLGGAG